MQSMGHFLNAPKATSDHSQYLSKDMISVKADLIHAHSQMQPNIESNRMKSSSSTSVEVHEKENVMLKAVSIFTVEMFDYLYLHLHCGRMTARE